jgi:hypothetical protein
VCVTAGSGRGGGVGLAGDVTDDPAQVAGGCRGGAEAAHLETLGAFLPVVREQGAGHFGGVEFAALGLGEALLQVLVDCFQMACWLLWSPCS